MIYEKSVIWFGLVKPSFHSTRGRGKTGQQNKTQTWSVFFYFLIPGYTLLKI